MSTRIDGTAIAQEILQQLKTEIHTHHLHPHLEVLLVGENTSSLSYIHQKERAAQQIGATVHLTQLPVSTRQEEVIQTVEHFNADSAVHGIIVQLPFPKESGLSNSINLRIAKEKDVDGFLPHSKFQPPIAKAVVTILERIFYRGYAASSGDLLSWLRTQEIVVIGKGKTAGKPVRQILEQMNIPVIGVDSTTDAPHELYKKATILISCVGKPDTVPAHTIQNGAILISVGLSKTAAGITGDYTEAEVAKKAAYYTPTPGGVGPVNVACLMQNLVDASR